MDGRRRACGAPRRPIGKLTAAEKIAGVRKGRYPAAVRGLRVPSDMVDMQVSAEHEIDVGTLDADCRQPFEETCVAALIPDRNFRPVLGTTSMACHPDTLNTQ